MLHIEEADTESETIYQTGIPGIERSHADENEAFNPLVKRLHVPLCLPPRRVT